MGDDAAIIHTARMLLAGGPLGLGRDEQLGIVQRRIGDPKAALVALNIAKSRSPQGHDTTHESVKALIALDRVAEAICLAEDSPHAGTLQLAYALNARARRGDVDASTVAHTAQLLTAHLATHPQDIRARHSLARQLITVQNFDEACRVTSGFASHTQTRSLVEWSALTADHRFSAAHELRRAHAKIVEAEPVGRTAPVGHYVRRVQAANYINGSIDAADLLAIRWPCFATHNEVMVRDKLLADLRLLHGDPEQLTSLATSAQRFNASAHDRFDATVRNRHALVVGPAPEHQPTPEQLLAADVVVTTRSRRLETASGQPTIAYVADESIWQHQSVHLDILSREPDHMIVMRPSIVSGAPPAIAKHPRARTMSFEDITVLDGTHFALNRIIYDLVAHGADRIEISGVDFFLGRETHVVDYGGRVESRTHDHQVFNHSHDHAYGFEYTKRALGNGLISAAPPIEAILARHTDDYLRSLEESYRSRLQPVRSSAMPGHARESSHIVSD